jgi:hypothetical protein
MRALIMGGTELISLHPYDCHAVHTLRTELGIRPRYTLASGLHHTWKWYQASGLLERPIDFTFEDQLLAKLGA